MSNIRLQKWNEDIDQLALELPQRHNNLFFQVKRQDFYKQIQDLKSNLEAYDHYMICVKIAAIVASARDAHTTVIMPIARFIPFEFYWFMEGIYILASFEEYTKFINCKVTHINGMPMDQVIERLKKIVSHENPSFLKAQLPKYLPAVDVLYGLEIIDEFEQLEFTVKTLRGEEIKTVIATSEYNELKRKGMKDSGFCKDELPLYRRNRDKNYWSYFMKEQNTVYFNYNSCKDMQDITVERFCKELTCFIEKEEVNRLVIDLRNNLGGNSSLLDPFIKELRKCKKLNRLGGIFVILGRETFSSALLNAYSIKNKTNAIFIGEATGGKPNCYGEVRFFELKNSRLQIRYSTQYYKIIKSNKQQSLFPDVNIEACFKDYFDNRDPCMEYILNLS